LAGWAVRYAVAGTDPIRTSRRYAIHAANEGVEMMK
jgi:hypothetical protein